MFDFCLVCTPETGGFKASRLTFDNDVQILADPSWDGENLADVDFIESCLSKTDLILLSHSTPEYIGGYALLCSRFYSLMASIPVYSTVAVSQLGRVSSVEFYRSKGALGPVVHASLEVSDIDDYFDRIISIKYSQNVSVLDNRVVLSAFNAGHSLGGSFWLIVKRNERIVYAPGWNQSRDSFLNGAQFLSTSTGNAHPSLSRPTAFITGSQMGSTLSHKRRAEELLNLVDATLANGGAVLLPVNISGRFLEALHLIDHHLAAIQGAAIPVYFMSYSGTKVLNYASGLSDWMASNITKEIEGMSGDEKSFTNSSFDPSKVDLLIDPSELASFPGPKIVFASGMEIQGGDLSSKALSLLCSDEKTTIILTERSNLSSSRSLAAQLYNEWFKLVKEKNGKVDDGVPVPLQKSIPPNIFVDETPLKGAELHSYQANVSERRHQRTLESMKSKRALNLLHADLQSDESDDDDHDVDDDVVEEELSERTIDVGLVSSNHAHEQRQSQPVSSSLQVAENSALPEVEKVSSSDPSLSGLQSAANASLSSHARPAFAIDENYITDFVIEKLNSKKPVDFRVLGKFRPRQAMFPGLGVKRRKCDDYGEVIDVKSYQREDEQNANAKLISESKRKFEEGGGKTWGHMDARKEKNKQDKDRLSTDNKLTPQQVLNNDILKRYLDAAFLPVKRTTVQRRSWVTLRCGLAFIDFSGYADVRSMNLVISSIKPSQLIILPDSSFHENQDDKLSGSNILANAHQQVETPDSSLFTVSTERSLKSSTIFSRKSHRLVSDMKVSVARPNLSIELSKSGRGARGIDFETSLDDKLWSTLKWRRIDQRYDITHIMGMVGLVTKELDTSAHNTLTDSNTQICIREVKASDRSPELSEKSSYVDEYNSKLAVGVVRMPELKKRLKALGFDAEFKGEGTLVVEDTIAIRKLDVSYAGENDVADLTIEGQVGPTYYKVRNCIKEMLAFIK
ncbi:hypothetical protein FT663_02510 [Candidozyma haemuli var. vulneris]|nr:hypothetical protein FT662_02659 [[Candida] haemuloni var. vulneris]KAF3991888.1 hypothetical protein FT663_02510 [[Candida] haemuloni var. vulneris]